MSSPKIINLDTIELSDLYNVALKYASDWMQSIRLSSHKSVTPLVSATWIRYSRQIDYLSFTVNENPFTIYVDAQTDTQQLKPADFSFPEKCVSQNVIQFFEHLTTILNEKFDFGKNMTGETSYIVDKKTKEVQVFNLFRPFFNFPDGSKSKNPTNIGHVRIDVKRPGNTRYDISLLDSGNEIQVTKLQELISFFAKFGTFKITIKPCRIVSCPAYFGNNYKLMWQVFMTERVYDSVDDIYFLKALSLANSGNESPSREGLEDNLENRQSSNILPSGLERPEEQLACLDRREENRAVLSDD